MTVLRAPLSSAKRYTQRTTLLPPPSFCTCSHLVLVLVEQVGEIDALALFIRVYHTEITRHVEEFTAVTEIDKLKPVELLQLMTFSSVR